jgi:hypothetical protein
MQNTSTNACCECTPSPLNHMSSQTKDTFDWLDDMTKDIEKLNMEHVKTFLNKYSKRNGCPFNAVVVSGDTDSIFIGVENTDEVSKLKRPITSPKTMRKRLRTLQRTTCINGSE